jgi:hypothetical protein
MTLSTALRYSRLSFMTRQSKYEQMRSFPKYEQSELMLNVVLFPEKISNRLTSSKSKARLSYNL